MGIIIIHSPKFKSMNLQLYFCCLILVAPLYATEKILTFEDLAEQINSLIDINAKNEERIKKLEEHLPVQEAEDDIDSRVTHLEGLTRSKLFRSCHETLLHGISLSGTYEIDRDGEAKGEFPIEVYCDFESGTTEVLHNLDEQAWTVPHCEEQFCSELNITYSATMSQIKALIEPSASCEQEIAFDCFLAPLVYNDVYIGAWSDRYGEKQIYFDGANYGNHMCACDRNNSCFGSETFANKCNCDNTFEHEWKEDLGYISNKTALPITGFYYGFLIYDVMEAMVEIGRLKCSGQAIYSETPNSCRDLKMRGEQKSGLYLIEDSDFSDFSMITKCNMDGPDYDEVEETRLGWTRFSTGPAKVVFTVRNSDTYEGPHNSSIHFDEVILNTGVSFERDTFTAPVQGDYEFSFSALSTGGDGHHFTIDIMVNNNFYQRMTADNYQFTYLSKSWTIPLITGDKVSLVLQDGAFYGEEMKAEFSGKLL